MFFTKLRKTFSAESLIETTPEPTSFLDTLQNKSLSFRQSCVVELAKQGKLSTLKRVVEEFSIPLNFKRNRVLLEACAHSQDDVACYILNQIDMNLLEREGEIVKIAVLNRRPRIVATMLQKQPEIATYNHSYFLRLACSINSKQIALLLLKQNADPTRDGCRALKNAIQNGHLEIIRTLFQSARLRKSEELPKCFILACDQRKSEAVKLLLATSRIDPTRNNFEALRISLQRRDKSSVKHFIDWFTRFKYPLINLINSFNVEEIRIVAEVLHPELPIVHSDPSQNVIVHLTPEKRLTVNREVLLRSEFFVACLHFKEMAGVRVEIEFGTYEFIDEYVLKVLIEFLAKGKFPRTITHEQLQKLQNIGEFFLIEHNLLDTMVERLMKVSL